MNLACQKLLGFTKVLGIGMTPHFGKNSQIIPYFFLRPSLIHHNALPTPSWFCLTFLMRISSQTTTPLLGSPPSKTVQERVSVLPARHSWNVGSWFLIACSGMLSIKKGNIWDFPNCIVGDSPSKPFENPLFEEREKVLDPCKFFNSIILRFHVGITWVKEVF